MTGRLSCALSPRAPTLLRLSRFVIWPLVELNTTPAQTSTTPSKGLQCPLAHPSPVTLKQWENLSIPPISFLQWNLLRHRFNTTGRQLINVRRLDSLIHSINNSPISPTCEDQLTILGRLVLHSRAVRCCVWTNSCCVSLLFGLFFFVFLWRTSWAVTAGHRLEGGRWSEDNIHCDAAFSGAVSWQVEARLLKRCNEAPEESSGSSFSRSLPTLCKGNNVFGCKACCVTADPVNYTVQWKIIQQADRSLRSVCWLTEKFWNEGVERQTWRMELEKVNTVETFMFDRTELDNSHWNQ